MTAERHGPFFLIVLVFSLLTWGCTTLKMKTEGRSASDQLLVAVSVQEALRQLDLRPHIENKRVFFTVEGHSSEIAYIQKVIPAHLMAQGATVEEKSEEADLILTFVVDTAGADLSTGGFSIPIILPSLSTGLTVTTIDFVQKEIQRGMCRVWVYATEAQQAHAFTSDPVSSQNSISNLTILGVSLGQRSEIKELDEKPPVFDKIPIP